MNVQEMKLTDLKPYENNPRKNDKAVRYVANSIKEFGFNVPLVVDKNNVIVCGHTRYKAAVELGMERVPCIMKTDLSDEQIKAYRLADNKVGEIASWDFELLDSELSDILNIDMEDLGFADTVNINWDDTPNLTDDSYEEPTKSQLKCPNCGHVAGKSFFKKVEE